MRRGEAAAFRELYVRFRPLLRRLAMRQRDVTDDTDALVTETLSDAALALSAYTSPIPRILAAYLTTALWNHIAVVRRAEARRRHWSAAAADAEPESPAGGEPATVGSSDATRTMAFGPGCDASPLSPVLERLVAHLETQLTDTERQMLVWLAHFVPQRTIAAWLGLSYDVTAKRVTRLRARLRAAAVRYADTLDAVERRELHHFFRRAAGASPTGRAAPPTPVRTTPERV